ncbi:hypothetical protein V6N13_075688 [Hibiscus sabdariffa]
MCEYLLWFVIDLCSECLCGGNPLYATSGLTGTMAVSIVDEQRNWDEMLITVDSTTQRRSRDDLESDIFICWKIGSMGFIIESNNINHLCFGFHTEPHASSSKTSILTCSKFLDFPSSMGREDNPGHWTLECLKFDNSYFKP